ncbi:hypothetical protein GF312_10090 [Candidatus Poribacteria bacterium]|nr:hypothetical protein [Candidatus Poribacteria bacterium]
MENADSYKSQPALDKILGILKNIADSIEILSANIKEVIQNKDKEEEEKLKKYKKEGILLEFTMVTGGIIIGTIVWVGSQSLGVKTKLGDQLIIYKHAIAFIQKQ